MKEEHDPLAPEPVEVSNLEEVLRTNPELFSTFPPERRLEFAADNGMEPFLPQQTAWHDLTNRDDWCHLFAPYLGPRHGWEVEIAHDHTTTAVHELLTPE